MRSVCGADAVTDRSAADGARSLLGGAAGGELGRVGDGSLGGWCVPGAGSPGIAGGCAGSGVAAASSGDGGGVSASCATPT
jgi:hypothetical protein